MATATDDVFTNLALSWEGRVTRDRCDSGLSRLVQEYDPSLRLVWDNCDQTFWVGKVRVVAGTDLLVPLFSLGFNPLPSEVEQELRSRNLRGRSKEVAAARLARMKMEQKKADEDAQEKFLPNYGEYHARLAQCDDCGTQDRLMEDMRLEVRRNR